MRGYTMDKDDYLKRLRRIEGQVRGLERLVDEDTYCIDILTQISAVTKALQSVAVGLLDQHIRDAATEDPQHADAMVAEATRANRASHQGMTGPCVGSGTHPFTRDRA